MSFLIGNGYESFCWKRSVRSFQLLMSGELHALRNAASFTSHVILGHFIPSVMKAGFDQHSVRGTQKSLAGIKVDVFFPGFGEHLSLRSIPCFQTYFPLILDGFLVDFGLIEEVSFITL